MNGRRREDIHRILVAIDAEADLADRDLARLDRALDQVVLDERVVGLQVDGEFAAGLLLHLVDEHADVLGVEIVLRIA